MLCLQVMLNCELVSSKMFMYETKINYFSIAYITYAKFKISSQTYNTTEIINLRNIYWLLYYICRMSTQCYKMIPLGVAYGKM